LGEEKAKEERCRFITPDSALDLPIQGKDMASWQKVIAHMVNRVEDHFDLLKYRFRERMGGRDPIMILPYRGFGTQEKIFLRGRVLEDKSITPAEENDTIWENLVNMYRRFESDEIPFARVLARFQGLEQEVQADIEGFFDLWLEQREPLPADRLWYPVELELLAPLREGYPPVNAEGQVLIVPKDAEFGVISDIDDTVLHTDAANLLRMARNVFLGNARTRLPFKGVAAFYRALLKGRSGQEINPLFYVSSSPWNLYDLLSEFFQLQDIPLGPMLFLRDWGITEDEFLVFGHRDHKLKAIRRTIDLLPDLPFILIGDSGQEDPEIYAEAVSLYPDRILAIYIRNVSHDLKRPEAIRELAKKVVEAGSVLILADDTIPMAEHAASQGWISPAALPEIREEKAKDEAPPSPVEKLLGEEEKEEGPTMVVEAETPAETEEAVEKGAVEAAVKSGEEKQEKPPTVVVKGDQEMKKD
jgi:phosphatidate phosphatase APP1